MKEENVSQSTHDEAAETAFLKSSYKYWIIGIFVMLALSIVGFVISKSELSWASVLENLQPALVASYLVIVLVWYGVIRFWHKHFYTDKEQEKQKNPFRKMFFGSINVISLILLGVGIFISFVIMSEGLFFLAISSFIAVVWTVVFLRYFMWSVYYYNINYGLTDNDWAKIFEKREKGLPESEINAPKQNPYRDETFGLPSGTVRGMIAFTLLFGGLALLLASMDMKSEITGSGYYADHFEFFKTAFLMMIAFYFGDSSMKYLSKRWGKNAESTNEANADEESTTASITDKKKALQKGTDTSTFE